MYEDELIIHFGFSKLEKRLYIICCDCLQFDLCQALMKSKVTRPYSPMIDAVIPKGGYILSPQQMPSSVSLNSTLGALNSD